MEDLAWRLRDAAAQGGVETIVALVAAGTDSNAGNMAGNTPLHFAAHAECSDAIRALIKVGTDRGATNCYGATALDIADRDERDAADALSER